MRKKLSIAIVIIFTLCLSMQVYAKDTYSSYSLSDCEIYVSVASNGVRVTYSTSANTRASEIGCKDIVLQEKVNGTWKNISIPTGKTTNSSFYGGNSVYTKAVKGRAYRAHCTHYADFNGTVKSLYNESDSVVFN